MSEFDFDLFVIGGGSGGVRAGRVTAQLGKRVALAEEDRYGGTCVVRGCVPKKLMVYASEFSQTFKDAVGYGWEIGEATFSWPKLFEAKNKELNRLETLYRKGLTDNGVTVFDQRARLKDAHTVVLADGSEHTAETILIAAGGHPFVPPVKGGEHAITSNEIFLLPDLPKRVLVVGGGYIACEFACILKGMGAEVHQFYRGAQILRGFDGEVRGHVADEMLAKGIDLHVGTEVTEIVKRDDGLHVACTNGSVCIVDTVLYATGRIPNTKGLGLNEVGVETAPNGAILVDEYSRSTVSSIYAVGDVTDRVNLTPVAIRDAMCFVETAFKGNPTPVDHDLIATAIFTQPEIGTVGMAEDDALAQGLDISIYRSAFRPMANILAGRDGRMLMKLIVDRGDRKVLGCHIVGHGAGEMIQMAAVAIKMGATKEDFDRTTAVHPTAAEELVTMREPVR